MKRTVKVRAAGRPSALLRELRRELSRIGDPQRAARQRAYMKSAMPYHGVATRGLRAACKKLFADMELPTRDSWKGQVLSLWRGAKFREERHAAIELTGHRLAKPFQTPAAMPLYEEIIVTGAWWDYVDLVASRRVGPILRDYPQPMKRMMLAWSMSPNIWKRRTSIICQLGFKCATDLDLLYACIEPSIDSPQFFLRKAIGWSLRQYAWTDRGEVKRYIEKNLARLSSLTVREALKNV